MKIFDLETPALLIDADALDQNLSTMAQALPGSRTRPHVKAHKCTALARRQKEFGHHAFTCATVREVEGMAAAGLGDDLLLANQVLDTTRLGQLDARVTVAVDSRETIAAARAGGVEEVLIDVNVGIRRCGCSPDKAGELAELARSSGLAVRGVMGYEGHAALVEDPTHRKNLVEKAMEGDLHRWMRQIGHDGRLFKSASDPVEVHSMAQRLSSEERVRVDEMARAGVDVDEVARRLGRHRSTVHRELKRGGGRCGYDAEAAQAAADLRARRPKTPKLAGDPVLAAAVGGLLADRMSPHAISAQLRSEGHGICAETVYAACYDHSGARGLPEGSWRLLPRRCRKRRPRGRHARKPSPLGDFKAISQRPASVEDRRQPGHWEGDLIIGKANRSAVATLVERTSRQTLTVALPHGYDAHNTAAAVTAALARQPRHLVKTLTWDQGREMARWPDIEATLGIEVYFCDPHSPWQRPTNEQTNGLLRR